jgi:hypothetical protein
MCTSILADPWATANFDDGNSSTQIDGFVGISGDGWADAWQKLNWYDMGPVNDYGYTLSYNPHYPSSGDYLYLHVEGEGGRMGVGRTCEEVGKNPLQSYTIDFSYRLESGLEYFNDVYDRCQFMEATYYRSSSASNCSWFIGVYGNNYEAANDGNIYWLLYDGLNDGNFYYDRVVNSNLTLAEDVTYQFSVTVNPMNRNYTATITNTATSESYTTPTPLGWRADTTTYPTEDFDGKIMFGSRTADTGDAINWSIDGITVTPESTVFQPALADGFKGIWYYNEPVSGPYPYKYAGGYATCCQQIRPLAQYSETANKTYFVYGGSDAQNSTLYECIAYYDHTTGQVCRPRILVDKQTTDAHDNPSLILDDSGYVYVFMNAHASMRPSYIARSTSPYSIDEFEVVLSMPSDNNFSYAQPHYIEGQGFFLFNTQYTDDGRTLYYNTSSDGINWDYDWATRPVLSQIHGGQYQVSNHHGQKVGTAFSYLEGKDADARTNLYYIESSNMGQTWQTAGGTSLTTPVTTVTNAALVHDYLSEGLLVYLKDIQYDAEGQPVIMYLTSDEWVPGPNGDPHQYHIAHFDDGAWEIKDLFTVDHNYDHGELTIEDDGTWRIIAPSIDGPQAYATGGEMAMWISNDEGDTWEMIRELTYDSDYNHSYSRQPFDVNEDFYAFWADGNGYELSQSCLYFTDKNGTGVWQLPYDMDTDFATPELAYTPKYIGIPGDANQDGKVDASDATILAGNWQAYPATWEMGDFNGDGKVNASDATILAGNWQYDATNTVVPEPSILISLIALLLAGFAMRQRG